MKTCPWIVVASLFACLASGAPQSAPIGVNLIVVSSQTEAANLRSRIRAGDSFELLAMRYSIGPSAEDGGYFVSAGAGGIRQEIGDALAKLKPGEVSPVEKLGKLFFLLRRSTSEEEAWRSQYTSALAQLRLQQLPEAIRLFSAVTENSTRFTSQDQKVALSLLHLSESYRLQGNYDLAAKPGRQSLDLFEKLLGTEHSGLLPSAENLAAIQLGTKDYAAAEQSYRRILSLRWSSKDKSLGEETLDVLEKLSAVLTDAYFRDSEFERDFRKFDQTLSRTSLREDLYGGMAQGLFRVDLVSEAEAVMQRGIEAFPNSRNVRYALGKLYVQASRYEAALGVFETATRMEGPSDPEADRQQRSVIYERIGSMNVLLVRFERALAAYTTALKLDPDNVKAQLGLADLYFRRGTLKEALDEYLRVVSSHRDLAAARQGLADVYLHQDRFAESAASAEKAVELDPKERSARYILGLALSRGGNNEAGRQALEEFERLEAEGHEHSKRLRALFELDRNAAMMFVEGNHEEAFRLWKQALSSMPDKAIESRVYMNLAVAQAKSELHREAARTFETMIELGADDFLIHRNLAVQYQSLKDPRFLEQRAIYMAKYNAALKILLN